jgi:hypothetical protein
MKRLNGPVLAVMTQPAVSVIIPHITASIVVPPVGAWSASLCRPRYQE